MKFINIILIASILVLLMGGGMAAKSGPIEMRTGANITLDGGYIHGMANGTADQDAVTYSQLVNRGGINVADYGADGSDGNDDWQGLQDAANASIGSSGMTLNFQGGIFYLSKPLLIEHAGVFLQGAGNPTTLLRPTTDFVGDQLILFNFTLTNVYAMYGCGVRDMKITMRDGILADAIEVRKAYDGTEFSDVTINEIEDTHSAIRFVPNPANPSIISQGILMENVVAYHTNNTATAPLFYFDTCNEINLIGVKGFGDIIDSTAIVNIFHFYECNGVTMIGCSAASSGAAGIKIDTDTNPPSTNTASEGFTILGTTFEDVDSLLDVDGTASKPVVGITMLGTRTIGAAIPNGVNLEYCTFSRIDVAEKPATLQSHAANNAIMFSTTSPSYTNSGTSNTMETISPRIIKSSVNAPFTIIRSTAATSGVYAATSIRAESSGNMLDTFGPLIYFAVTDTGVSNSNLGSFGAIRNGADNTGKLVFNVYSAGSEVEAMTLSNAGDLWILRDCSAAGYVTRSPGFTGDALSEISKIKTKDGEIDHDTLPAFTRATYETPIYKKKAIDGNKTIIGYENKPGQNLGNTVSMLIVAVQQLDAENKELKRRIEVLEKAAGR